MIAILDYGVGNLKSIDNCFKRLGYSTCLTTDPETILNAALLVLPGVGRFETAVTALAASGTLPALNQRRAEKKPILGICLGMQLFFDASEESPGFKGLGWLPGTVRRLPQDLPLPHMGWNTVTPTTSLLRHKPLSAGLQEILGKDMYYVHSYVACPQNRDAVLLETRYTDVFPALVGEPAAQLYGLQGHPEKSGKIGEILLKGLLQAMKIPASTQEQNLASKTTPTSAPASPIQRLAAMDLLDGQVVRLRQGRYDQVTVFGEPEVFAERLKTMGFDGLHLINLNGAKGEPLRNLDIICRLAKAYPGMVQVGGGIRTLQAAERLLFLGCNIIVSTWFFEDYSSLKALATAYPRRISLSLDIREGQVMTRGWLKAETLTLDEILALAAPLNLASLILTDIASDGMGSGICTAFFSAIAQRIQTAAQQLPQFTQSPQASQLPLCAAGGMPLEATALLPLAELGYSQAVIGLSLYKALTSPQCPSPLCPQESPC